MHNDKLGLVLGYAKSQISQNHGVGLDEHSDVRLTVDRSSLSLQTAPANAPSFKSKFMLQDQLNHRVAGATAVAADMSFVRIHNGPRRSFLSVASTQTLSQVTDKIAGKFHDHQTEPEP